MRVWNKARSVGKGIPEHANKKIKQAVKAGGNV